MLNLMLLMRARINSFDKNLVNIFYGLLIVVSYWDMTVGKTDMVTPFLELIV